MATNKLPVISQESDFRQYLAEIRKFPVLDADEEYMLAKSWAEHGDYDAAHKLVTSHLRLVVKIAAGFRGYGLPFTELVSEGNIGLMQAVKRFDAERGFRLSTYAMWWVRAAIQEYVLRSWSLVKMGTSAAQKRLFFNLRSLKRNLQAVEAGQLRPETITEIARILDVSESEVVDMDQRMSATDQRLDAPVGGLDGETNWGDLMPSGEISQEEDFAEKQEQKIRHGLLKRALAKLNPRERDIFQRRRLSESPTTLEDLSKEHNISRERVRQIEVRAMEKLTEMVQEAA